MPVLINWKICDNSIDCNGIGTCPVKAFQWNAEKKTLFIDKEKCTDCGACGTCCPVGAIRFAKTEEEAKKIQKEIDNDPRTVSDLFVDRYGSTPISTAFLIPQEKFDTKMIESTKLCVAEFFKNNTIKCLIKSIPMKELFPHSDIKYRKVKIENDSILKKYEIKILPALLFIKDGKVLGKIEGYYNVDKKEELLKKIKEITT
jgi:NAD-dependent dihydropyrimidine dehydrogenase PreA subunit